MVYLKVFIILATPKKDLYVDIFIFSDSFSIYFSYFLFTKIKNIQGKEVKVKPGDLVLPKLKEMPNIEDIDTDSKILQDIIESSKLENWNASVSDDSHAMSRHWRLEISNPQNTLKINTVLRIYDLDSSIKDNISVGYFTVDYISPNDGSKRISFDTKNDFQRYLMIEYLWGIILSKNQESYNYMLDITIEAIKIIESKLTTLKRDRQLKKIFENSLEDTN